MNDPLRQRAPDPQAPGKHAPDDVGIPLLTERLTVPATLPPLDLDITLPPSVQPLKLDLPLGREPAMAPPAAPLPQGAPVDRIEVELRESVLKALAEQLPQNVEYIVRQHVSAATDAAVRAVTETLIERLSADARLALAASLREIVERAVKSELARFRAQRR